MKHEGFATAFERLDREILALRKEIGLSSLYAWNWESKLAREPQDPCVLFSLPEICALGLALWAVFCH
jgi:hypothetical protein